MLNITIDTDPYHRDRVGIIYLNDENQRIDMAGLRSNIKIYDYAASYASESLLSYLQNTGFYQLHCYQEKGGRMTESKKQSVDAMNQNRISAVMIISSDFDALLSAGKASEGIEIFFGHEDVIIEGFIDNTNRFFQLYHQLAMTANGNQETIWPFFTEIKEASPIVLNHFLGDGKTRLTKAMMLQKINAMYSFALISMAFVLSGVFVSNLIIMERHNGTLKRMRLSDVTMNGYLMVKLLMAVLTVAIQILVMGLVIWLFVKVDFGITIAQYLGVAFGLAIVLNLFSLVVGILVNNVLTTTYVAFCAGVVLTLVSGLYFPGMELKGWLAAASLLAPQRWSVKALDLLLLNEQGVWGYYAMGMGAFLAVFGCIGVLGLAGIRKEEG